MPHVHQHAFCHPIVPPPPPSQEQWQEPSRSQSHPASWWSSSARPEDAAPWSSVRSEEQPAPRLLPWETKPAACSVQESASENDSERTPWAQETTGVVLANGATGKDRCKDADSATHERALPWAHETAGVVLANGATGKDYCEDPGTTQRENRAQSLGWQSRDDHQESWHVHDDEDGHAWSHIDWKSQDDQEIVEWKPQQKLCRNKSHEALKAREPPKVSIKTHGAAKLQAKPKAKGQGKGKAQRDGSNVHREAPEMFGDTWEEPRKDTGLTLVQEDAKLSAPQAKWVYAVHDDSRRCYAGCLRKALTETQSRHFFEAIRDDTSWGRPAPKSGRAPPRKTAFMVQEGCQCRYQYSGITVEPQAFPRCVQKLMAKVMPLFGIRDRSLWPNCCNVNLYEDGGHSVGWHTDDERIFQGKFQDIRILSMSFGQTRSFEMRPIWPEDGEKTHYKVLLGNGDLATMEGMFQKHYLHRVPKDASQGPRINLTWRWVVKHMPECPMKTPRLRW